MYRAFTLIFFILAVAAISCTNLLSSVIAPSSSSSSSLGPTSAVSRLHHAQRRQAETKCGFRGDADIYGIGIRIGYYSQALSVWFANFFIVSEAKVLRSVNGLFLFALFVGLAWFSRNPSDVYAIESFLLLQLLFATWYVALLGKGRYSNKFFRFSAMRMIIEDLTVLGLLAYTVWFWWTGLDRMKRTPCGTRIFLFAKVDLFGWYRSANRVLCIAASVFKVIILMGHVAQLWHHWVTRSWANLEFYHNLQEALRNESARSKLDVGFTALGSPVFSSSTSDDQQEKILNLAIRTSLPASPRLPSKSSPLQSRLLKIHSTINRPSLATQKPTHHIPSTHELKIASDYLHQILASGSKDHHTFSTYTIPHTPIKINLPSPSHLFPRTRRKTTFSPQPHPQPQHPRKNPNTNRMQHPSPNLLRQ